MPNTPTWSNNFAPITNADKGANHQKVKAPSESAHSAGFYTPVPVASALAGAVITTSYSETVTAQGGTSPYTFSLASGSLPTGISLASGGTISGVGTTPGTYSFTILVTDANSYTGTQAFSIIASLPQIEGNGGFVA